MDYAVNCWTLNLVLLPPAQFFLSLILNVILSSGGGGTSTHWPVITTEL
jgi:hypothetical protein